jgi:hypothetical protein
MRQALSKTLVFRNFMLYIAKRPLNFVLIPGGQLYEAIPYYPALFAMPLFPGGPAAQGKKISQPLMGD